MSEYMDRLKAVDTILMDPAAVARYHDQGQSWLQEHLMSGITTGEPLSLLISSLLMQLRTEPAEAVLAGGVTTLAVSSTSLYINGVCVCHPQGLIRGEAPLARSVLLHEAMHIILLHNIRLTELLRALTDAGYLDAPGRLSSGVAMQVANLVLDVVVDSMAGEAAASLRQYSHALLDEHRMFCEAGLTKFIDEFCTGLDPRHLYRQVGNQSLDVMSAIRQIIIAIDPSRDEEAGKALQDVECHVQPLEDDSPSSIEAARTMQAAMVMSAGQQAGSGTALGALCINACEWLNPPKVSWQEQLESVVASRSDDLSYQYQAQNDLYRGIIFPDYKPGVGAIALAFDTSGSVVGDKELRSQLLTEFAEILGQLPFETLYFLPCDSKVKACIEMKPGDPIPQEHFVGGGGTSFDGPFQYLAEHGIEVDTLCYFTDGYGCVSVDQPDYPVVWLLGTNSTDSHLPWGEVIRVE